ncbi:hypothetical protein PsYK624_136500 [Phanerochaete sordida]|uniref:DUF6534 domain-containing protein n=1 Tax=Phanerochaete sordida TaxID=48140 RepID=A0A9P3GLY2_9APHY|nr:hypothetical protein PsYK624_136500 [Phanerochaete sordida]
MAHMDTVLHADYGRNPAVGVILTIAILLTFSCITAQGGKVAALGEFALLHSVDWLLYTGSALDFALNLVLSSATALALARTRRSPLYRWDYLVTAPVVYMAHTGALCIAEALLVIVLRVLRPDDFVYFGVFIPYSVMYANALVGFLNSGALAAAAAQSKPSYPLHALPAHAHVLSELVDAKAVIESGAASGHEPLAVLVETVVEKERRTMALL